MAAATNISLLRSLDCSYGTCRGDGRAGAHPYRRSSSQPFLICTVRGGIRVLFKGNHSEWRQIDADRVALTLPGDGIRVDTAEVTDVTAAVRFCIRIQDFFVPTFTGGSDPISVTRNRGSVDGENEDRAILGFTKITNDAALGVMEIDPVKTFVRIIQLPQCRLSLIEVIQVLDEALQAGVPGEL